MRQETAASAIDPFDYTHLHRLEEHVLVTPRGAGESIALRAAIAAIAVFVLLPSCSCFYASAGIAGSRTLRDTRMPPHADVPLETHMPMEIGSLSHPIRNYFVCATPRSSSNVLCAVLGSLQFAGRPYEHLWDPDGVELEPLATRWPRVLEAATGPNGVFGIKLMWYQMERLERELPGLLGGQDGGLGSVLGHELDNPAYVYLRRREHLRQAVSFVRAMQTRQWRSMDAISGEPAYDRVEIEDAIRWLEGNERDWDAFFARNEISPYALAYEELNADLEGTIGELLRVLGYDGPLPVTMPAPRHQRQADAVTKEWICRYVNESTRG